MQVRPHPPKGLTVSGSVFFGRVRAFSSTLPAGPYTSQHNEPTAGPPGNAPNLPGVPKRAESQPSCLEREARDQLARARLSTGSVDPVDVTVACRQRAGASAGEVVASRSGSRRSHRSESS